MKLFCQGDYLEHSVFQLEQLYDVCTLYSYDDFRNVYIFCLKRLGKGLGKPDSDKNLSIKSYLDRSIRSLLYRFNVN